eukprot:8808257-Lingulodinium_polyedra.AAC.1
MQFLLCAITLLQFFSALARIIYDNARGAARHLKAQSLRRARNPAADVAWRSLAGLERAIDRLHAPARLQGPGR